MAIQQLNQQEVAHVSGGGLLSNTITAVSGIVAGAPTLVGSTLATVNGLVGAILADVFALVGSLTGAGSLLGAVSSLSI